MITVTKTKTNHTEPNFELSILTNKPDHMTELLEVTRKMTTYFKRSFKHNKPNYNDNNTPNTSTNHHNNYHSDKHKNKPQK